MAQVLWSGRLEAKPEAEALSFESSIAVDSRLAREDITGSRAHVAMLAKQGIIPAEAAQAIDEELGRISAELAEGTLQIDMEAEDIHSFIEAVLTERLGDVGRMVHAGRSRNDQVALDLRLYVREAITAIRDGIRTLQKVIVSKAEVHLNTLMPGYTHLQRAQPMLLAHHLMAYFEMLQRDRERFAGCLVRVNVLPLGAGALAGTTLPIDPAYVAKLLAFPTVAANSEDAVSDRDFAVEFLSCCAILAMHISRLAEELVLWASAEFGFIELSDAFATGSSIMPQKKNPDVAELARGKTGRVYGNLVSLLTILKGLPLSYNRDLQEDKEPVFDTTDTIRRMLDVLPPMLLAIKFRVDRMQAAAAEGFMNATDLADYLVTKGIAFREAHEIVGRIVRYCVESGERLEALSLARLREFCPVFKPDVSKYITAEACVERRLSPGGTSSRRVSEAIQQAKRTLQRP